LKPYQASTLKKRGVAHNPGTKQRKARPLPEALNLTLNRLDSKEASERLVVQPSHQRLTEGMNNEDGSGGVILLAGDDG